MKKNIPFWAKCLLVVALLAAAYFWYTRPMTLDRLCPSFRWAETTHVGGYEQVGNISAPSPIISSTALPISEPGARGRAPRGLAARVRRAPGPARAPSLSATRRPGPSTNGVWRPGSAGTPGPPSPTF